jgi:pimeloyl-ACP methyl ester carboxylesterase
MKINREVVLKNNNIDTIQYYARKIFKESFIGNNLESVRRMNLSGIDEKITASQFIDTMLFMLYSPLNVTYLKWDPENYYPKINCPVLMCFGDKDINIDFEGSLANSKEIVKRYKKTNFTIEVINGVGHNFSDKQMIVKEKDGMTSPPLGVKADIYYQKLFSWLNKTQLL